MLRDAVHVVLHDSLVHDLCVQAIDISLVFLGSRGFGLFVSQEGSARTPLENRSCRSFVGWVPTHVVAIVLLIQLSLPLIEVRISFVHPRVSALAKRGILLMILSGSSSRYFSLQTALVAVQCVHHRVVFVQKWVRSPAIQQSR